MPSPDHKRSTRTTTGETTADIYGARHGIPEDVQAALQSVGARARQNVGRGRTLQPTQSLPTIPSSSGIFKTANEAAVEAAILVKNAWHTRELQPFGSPSSTYNPIASDSVDALSLSPRTMAHRLAFENGEVRLERRGQKRGEAGLEDDADGGGDTDVDDEESDLPQPQTLPNVSHDFPPVFIVPPSQPQLDTNHQGMPPPPVPAGRQMRGLPRRTALTKAVSAPVGRIGAGFMDVDEEDGFDVSDWARDQDFDVAQAAENDQF